MQEALEGRGEGHVIIVLLCVLIIRCYSWEKSEKTTHSFLIPTHNYLSSIGFKIVSKPLKNKLNIRYFVSRFQLVRTSRLLPHKPKVAVSTAAQLIGCDYRQEKYFSCCRADLPMLGWTPQNRTASL